MVSSSPSDLGLDETRWRSVEQLADSLTASDELPALALCVVRAGRQLGPLAFGRRRLAPGAQKLVPNDRFVVASLTKPIVAMAVVRLAEQGRLSLNDRVTDYLSEYDDAPRKPTTLRHLLTHTSGLPDMLPNNLPLRKAQSPLSKFVEGACAVSLDFPPGRGVQYQSLGYALLGEIVARVTGLPSGEFLRREFFEPLGMQDTSLASPEWARDSAFPDRLAEIRVPADMQGGDDWNWNSPYWRTFGAPWGGLVSTAEDLARYCAMILGGGQLEGTRVLSAAAVESATRNQLDAFHDLPESDRRTRPWGLGWRLNWPTHAASFGDFLSPATYGHWGATGTLFWIDPSRQMAAVLLSTQPLERDRSPLVRVSNAIAGCIVR